MSKTDWFPQDDVSTFGARIKTLRKRWGMTPAQLARAMGEKRETNLLNWERGRTPRTDQADLAMRIVTALPMPEHARRVAAEWLLFGEEYAAGDSNPEPSDYDTLAHAA